MITQDHIYELLTHYLKEKGLMAEEHLKSAWNHIHEKIFKDHMYFGLGFSHPIHIPTALEHIPEAIRNDAMWLEGKGKELWEKITGKAAEAPAPAPASAPATDTTSDAEQVEQSDSAGGGSAPSPQFKTGDNGDLSFAFQTGVNQVRPTTTEEQLATEVQTKTDAVASEISTGEVVTEQTLNADKAAEAAAEAEVAASEAPAPAPATEEAPAAAAPAPAPTEAPAAPAPAPAPAPEVAAPAPAPAPAADDDLNIEGA